MIEADSRTLVVSDLDGTLLRSDGTLGARTVDSINAFVAAGGWFTYATARSFTSASRVTRELNLTLPVVTYGGAVIVDPRTGEPRPATVLPETAVRDLLTATDAVGGIEPIVFAICDGRDRVCWRTARLTAGISRFLSRRRDDPRLLPLCDWSTIDLRTVFYVSLIGDRGALDELRGSLARPDVHLVFSEDIYTTGEWWLELSSVDATKATALIDVRDELGADRLVCFGDNQNDLPMFAIADWSVAVGNAVQDVRSAADEIVGTNDSDGVAQWLAAHPEALAPPRP